MAKIIIIGGGWAGCAAAVAAKKLGVQVLLLERTDLLLGLGNVGGIMRNNGRFTAAEENIAMGAGELFEITDSLATHVNVDFPGHQHASFYDTNRIEPEVRQLLVEMGVEVRLKCRIVDVEKTDHSMTGLLSADGEYFWADAFVDCTGTTGPMGNCYQYGNGCSMCILRCPAFGPRVSISAKAGGCDYYGYRDDGTPGAFSGSCKLRKDSLSKELRNQLDIWGKVIVPLPKHLINKGKLNQKVCRQYALPQFAENLVLLDTGEAKLMTPYLPLEDLRTIEGFEHAIYQDPYAGGRGNSIRYMAITQRNHWMSVIGVENLFCGGEKAGPYIGHTEAITTGTLAGFNAASYASGKPLLNLVEMPGETKTAIGEFLSYEKDDRGMITFAGDAFFDHMKKKKLYTTDVEEIRRRIDQAGLLERYNTFL